MQAYHYESVDSTNEEAKRLIKGGTITRPAFLLAQTQSAGKGTSGRTWVSPKDAGLYLSLVNFPRCPANQQATLFTLASGIACVEALKESAGVTVHLKSINDLYVNGGKLGGILTETIISDGKVEALITGIGINTHRADRSLVDGSTTPVCLQELLPFIQFARLDLERLVAVLIARVTTWHQKVVNGQIVSIRSAWERFALPGATWPGDHPEEAPSD